MSSGAPLISVIIPVYNRAELVEKAIASVLSQSFPDFELIIVDDGSTDDTARAVGKFQDTRIRILTHDTNRGGSAARNTGITASSGRYCAFLDSDDHWLPNKLEQQLAFMQRGATQGPISCTHYHISTRYRPEGEVREQPRVLNFRQMLYGCTAGPGSTMMAERAFLHDVGLYDAGLRRLEDWDLLLRAARKSPINVLAEPLSVVSFVDARISYEVVAACCQKIDARCRPFGLRWWERAILRGTIENELAVAAYRSRRFGLALFHFAKSLLLTPRRETSYFVRIARAVWKDVTHKAGREASSDHRGPDSRGNTSG